MSKGMMMKKIMGAVAVAFSVVLLAGCGGINEDTPMEKVSAKAAKMDQAALQEMTDQYDVIIAEKITQLDAIKAQVSEIPLKELMGEQAKVLKIDLGALKTSLKKLNAQLDVFVSEQSKR